MNKLNAIQIEPGLDLQALRAFVREKIAPQSVKNFNDGEFQMSHYEELHKLGFLQAITPERFGGPEMRVADLIWVVRELGYGSPGVAATFIGNLLGYSTVVLYASEKLREKLCRKHHKNFGLWSFGMTEGGCGSDLLKTSTRAVKVKGGYRITGEKNFITNSLVSVDLGIFASVQSHDSGPSGISCFYIPGDSPGLKRGEVMDKIGWRDSITGTLYMEEVFVPDEHLLGGIGEGLKILTHCLNRSKTLLAASGVGLSYRAIDLVTERLAGLNRYDKPLMIQPVLRHELARMHTEVQAAWLLTCLAATTWDSGEVAVREASMAKLFSGKTALAVTGKAVELFGARGFFNDYEVSRLWRDAKGIEIVEGPSQVQELLIAKQVLPEMAKPSSKSKKEDPFLLTLENKKKVA